MRKFFSSLQLKIQRSLTKNYTYNIQLTSHFFPVTAQELKREWNQFHQEFHPYPPRFRLLRAESVTTPHFIAEVVGKSRLQLSIEINAHYFPEIFLLRLLPSLHRRFIECEISKFEEFSEYMKGEKFHRQYRKNRELKGTFTLAKGFYFNEAFGKITKCPSNEINTILGKNKMAKEDRNHQTLIHMIKVPIVGIQYKWMDVSFHDDASVWLLDIFAEIREVEPKLSEKTRMEYLGSLYSHREVLELCMNLRLKRNELNYEFLEHSKGIEGNRKNDTSYFRINPLSRFRNSQGAVCENPALPMFVRLNAGFYSLDTNLWDHSPLDSGITS